MKPITALRQYWGYEQFRPLQEDIINAVLNGTDTLALLPTGGGKSICFQVPALCMEGICIVISPLIALMKDQVFNLKKRGISAAAIFSGMQRREVDIVFENACQGMYKFLYISPERLKTDMAIARIQRMNVCLLAVDEAHCISQWGYDFRPPYLEIAAVRKLIPKTPILALTATATTEVVQDIQEKLEFSKKNVFKQSFSRQNLSYSVLYEDQKHAKMVDILSKIPGTGIVYARSRGETKDIAHFLAKHKISADFYHAGLTHEERSKKQEDWIQNKIRIMVCTNAFGMGIDKPDVRVVIHMHIPDTLEAYFQEAGRAGRDGNKAYATVLYAAADTDTLRSTLALSFPPLDLVRRTYQALGSYTQLAVGAGLGESFDFDMTYFCSAYKLDQAQTHIVLKLLEQDGWIAMTEAAMMPSQVQILADRQTLYDYQLKNKQADAVIKVLLRAYPGIHVNFVDINEAVVGQYAKLPVPTVINLLDTAMKEQVLEYHKRTEKPQLTFTRERVHSDRLTLDMARFNFRKQRAEYSVEEVIRYGTTLRCRSRMLLAYFDEHESELCGICDVCTGRNKPEIDMETFLLYEQKLARLLKKEHLSLSEILQAFAPKRHDLVCKVIQYLLDEKRLDTDENGRLLLPVK